MDRNPRFTWSRVGTSTLAGTVIFFCSLAESLCAPAGKGKGNETLTATNAFTTNGVSAVDAAKLKPFKLPVPSDLLTHPLPVQAGPRERAKTPAEPMSKAKQEQLWRQIEEHYVRIEREKPPVLREPQVVERGSHHNQWETYRLMTNETGRAELRTNSYVELGMGLNRIEDGALVPSRAIVELHPQGAVGRQGSHKVIFGPNINRAKAIELETPDGKVLKSHVLGLFYFDVANGKSVRISGLKDSEGAVHPPNQVIYQDAFAEIRADLRYTYKLHGFEQDVILREQPPSPEDVGLNSETAQLVVLTEFVDAPEPRREARVLKKKQIQGREVDALTDETLDFGRMLMGPGRAFRLEEQPVQLPNKALDRVPVGKRWLQQGGRTYLIEAVEYPDIKPHLPGLPKRAQLLERRPLMELKEMLTAFPSPVGAPPGRNGRMQMASVPLRGAGLVVDYDLVYTASDFTFEGGKTYYVSGSVQLNGTTTIEGGTVVKYAPGGSVTLSIYGPVVLKTSDYQPAIFTARDDNSVGETITGSTGSPAGNYASTALDFPVGTTDPLTLENLRVKHAFFSITAITRGLVTLRNLQVLNCFLGPYVGNSGVKVENCLVANTSYALLGDNNADWLVSHCTFSGCGTAFWMGGSGVVRLTNNVFATVSSLGVYPGITGTQNGRYNSPNIGLPGMVGEAYSNPFQSVGGGDYYLVSGSSWRNGGTPALEATLATSVARKTTEPPLIVSGMLSGSVTFAKRAIRDTSNPDLGYHYSPLDYVFTGVALQGGAKLTIQPGTCIGVANQSGSGMAYGLHLNAFANTELRCVGLPTEPNRFVLFNAVQEGGNANWNQNISGLVYGASSAFFGLLQFTEFNVPGTRSIGTFYNSMISAGGSAFIEHCSFRGGNFRLGGIQAVLRSALFERVSLDGYSSGANTFNNCTFAGGSASLDTSFFGGSILVQDSIFSKTTATSAGNVTHDHNGYITGYSRLSPAQATDVVVSDFAFETGPWGSYYLPAGSPFLNMGSKTASLAKLHHCTTITTQTKEAATTVDLGFHYVAVDGTGKPVDTDGDGLPDYFEDDNGNGSLDSGETAFTTAYTYHGSLHDATVDLDYDGVTTLMELVQGTDPLDATDYVQESRLLGRWRFDTAALPGDQGQTPRSAVHANLVASWNANAVELSGNSVQTRLLNIDYGSAAPPGPYKVGPAAFGLTANDYWYPYYNPWVTDVTVQNLLWSDQAPLPASATLRVQNAPGQWGSETGDLMYNGYCYDWNGAGIASTYNGLPAGLYELYLYGHGAWFDQNTIFSVFTASRNFGSKNTIVSADWASINWTENLQYVKYTGVLLAEGEALQINAAHLNAWYFGVNGMQLVRKVASQLAYREVEANGQPNIHLKRGTVMFWLRPNWTSGTGPGHEARFIEVGDKGSSGGWWAIHSNPTGTELRLTTQAGGTTVNNLVCPVQLGNVWTHVAVTYSESGSAIYVNGAQAATGAGITLTPSMVARCVSGLNVGGDWTGWNNVRGQLDEMEIHNYPFTAGEIQSAYNTMATRDSDWDQLFDRFEHQYGLNFQNWNDPNADTDYDGRTALQEQSEGTDPNNGASAASVQLGRWRFNTTAWLGDQGQTPISTVNLSSALGLQGNAVRNRNAGAGRLAYRDVETSGAANINCRRGTVRFWFRPQWSSTTSGGTGPGSAGYGRLIDMGAWTPDGSTGFWALHFDPNGTTLFFTSQGGGSVGVTGTINWQAESWHQVAVTYDQAAMAIYVDGQLLQQGGPLTAYPSAAVRTATGMNIGANQYGNEQGLGDFEELETFNYALTAAQIQQQYNEFQTSLLDPDYDGVRTIDELVEGTNPNDANSYQPRSLGYWRFNTSALTGEMGQAPLAMNNVSTVASWDGSALQHRNASAGRLAYKDTEADGRPNINCRRGTVRFWFRPQWSSTTAGGTGPGEWGRLLELGQWTGDNSIGNWQIHLNPDGTQLYFFSQTNGAAAAHVSPTINWTANNWHQITLCYGPSAVALYIDGQLAQSGSGITMWPNSTVRAGSGLNLGSDQYQGQKALGDFDEFETFNYELNATQVQAQYAGVAYSPIDIDGDGLTGAEELALGSNPLLADTDGDGVSDYTENLQGRNPLVAGTGGNPADVQLKVFSRGLR